jgi:predicted ATPase with chaperone activity
VRLYDPNKHKEVAADPATAKAVDGRWVRIERPTIIAGGELRMENLEITYTRGSGIGEAPLQLKANCGTLLIDDFGRQRMNVDELLNRWIVPLEERHDFLYLESGRTIQVPFDELIVFSTNLEPRDLVEEAFLRRIPYKIEVSDPSDEQFRDLFLQLARDMHIECSPELVSYLLERHYHVAGRGTRFCHPRDLLRQIENYCRVHEVPLEATTERIDVAVQNYFSIM